MDQPGVGESFGRWVQSRIYRAGALGQGPNVPVSATRLRAKATRRMSRRAAAYVNGSAGSEWTAHANRRAFDRWRIVPRMLKDVSQRDMSVELLGLKLNSPLLFAPVGVLEMVHPDADVAVARASERLGNPMIMSTQASRSMEECAAELSHTPHWYQLYWSRVDGLAESMVKRAEASGASAIVVTLDTHMLGWRPRDLDEAFLPFARGQGLGQYMSDPVFLELVKEHAARPRDSKRPMPTPAAIRTLIGMSKGYPGRVIDNVTSPLPQAAVETFLDVFSRSDLTWDDLSFLRDRTTLPIILKGIQHRDDARRAVETGVDGVIVSNHGGRQVDGAVGSLDMLPGIVDEIDDRIPVLFDSGIRAGADVFKALALGADAVCVGRPYVYGLALDGVDGVVSVMQNLRAELDLTMSLAGCCSLADINRDTVTQTGP